MKIIFISSMPTSKIFGDRMDLWWFNENGFDVELWDLSEIFWSKRALKAYYGGIKGYKFLGPEHILFASKKEFKESLSKIPKGTIFWHMNWEITRIRFNEYWVLFALRRNNIKLIIKQYDKRPRRGVTGFIRGIIGINMAKLTFLILPPLIIVGCGLYSRKSSRYALPYTNFVSVPSPRVNWNFNKNPERRSVVLVDETIEYAPDAKMFGKEICTDLKGYYNRLNNIFDLIEAELNLPVLIAASGKYKYPTNPFNNRKIVYGKTFDLVNNAHFILGHSSSALEQAVISRTPMALINDTSFSAIKKNDVEDTAYFFGLKSIYSHNLAEIRQHLLEDKDQAKRWSCKINSYFREPGVTGDYKEITKDAIESLY